MLRYVFQSLAVLIPIGLFALALQPVQQRLYGGHATQGILLLLGALALLAVVEGLLFRYWILPGFSEKVAERLYAGSYLPEDDALARLVEQAESEKSAEILALLEAQVRRDGCRLRGWLELARLRQEVQHDAASALAALEEATRSVRDPEDVALLMFRAAHVCEKSLQDSAAARRWFERAAAEYPHTVYGRRAAKALLS